MQPLIQRVLVVGGNGFLGSAVCRAALAKGMQVTSISSSGKPFKTPKGHTPAWTSKVDWQRGDALQPESYAHLMPGATAVVHTLGTLLEDTRYKSALKEGSVSGLVGAFISSIAEGSSGRNPLEEPKKGNNSYEVLNRDAALRVCETFLASEPEVEIEGPRPFVYVSAEDIFRPVIPARYIETKREAEVCIEEMIQDNPKFRGVYIRPSLIYHPHFRPLTSPIAAALDLSATIHSKLPSSIPTPSSFLRSLSPAFKSSEEYPLVSPSPFDSVANALTIPPIHVDHVAEAAIIAAENERIDVSGVYGVDEMRELIGWVRKGQAEIDPSHVERLRQHA